MLRSEIRLTDLEPTRGSQASKRRPAVIVGNDRANATAERAGRGVVTIVPVTSNISRVFPFQTMLPADATGLRADPKPQAKQIRSVTIERIGPVIGQVPAQLMLELDNAIRLHLHLSRTQSLPRDAPHAPGHRRRQWTSRPRVSCAVLAGGPKATASSSGSCMSRTRRAVAGKNPACRSRSPLWRCRSGLRSR